MSEELLQRDLKKNPPKFGRWDFYNIGATTVKALKEHGIIRNVNYGNEEKKKVDALIVYKKNVIAVIEYKKPSEFKTTEQKDRAIKQELEVARKLNARIFIATDTKESVWVNVATGNRIKDEKGKELKINFDPKGEKQPELFEKIKASINEKNDQIKPRELVNPTDLAKQIWQDIWSVSGATAENCLYTFVELFIFKYLSDLDVLRGIYSFNAVVDSFKTNTDDEILENYANVIRPQIKKLFPKGNDGTTIINGTIFVSKDQKAVAGYSTVFKKVLLRFKEYGKLENIDYDFKSKLFESFLKESISKKNWGQFFTPLKVVRAIVEMAKDNIKEGVSICDPACGVGKFLLEPLVTRLDDLYDISKKGIIPKITIHGFDKGFDKDEQKTIILAKANMLIYFSDLIRENSGLTEEFSKLFNESFTLKTNSILGTLSEPVVDEYDLILTNPPYVTSGSSNLKDEIKKDGTLVDYYKINAMGVEGLFMEWIIRALKPNGKAFIILPENFFSRISDVNIRKFILETCLIDGILSLPRKTFFSTVQQTSILCITKKNRINENQIKPVFTYIISEIGEGRDVNRFNIDQDDLSDAVELFRGFKGSPEYIIKNNTEKRCKIIPIEWFVKNSSSGWSIEKLWTKEEKAELKINETEASVSVVDYRASIQETLDNIENLKNELDGLNEMPDNIRYVTKALEEIVDFKSGNSKLTQVYMDKHKGEFVVYSSNTKNGGIFGYIDSYDFDQECIQITTNGVYAGTVFYRPKHKFSINGDARLLVKKHKDIDYCYLLSELREVFAERSFNWENKPTLAKTRGTEIRIPVDTNDMFSMAIQKELASNFSKIEFIKKSIASELEKLSNLNVKL
jgi:type I restriction-modification system DNA methylase subunit